MEKMDMTNPEGVIRYTPSFQEELTGVRLIGMIHTTGLRAIIETVILLVAAGLFLSSYIREQDGNALFFALVCLVLIVVVWLVPELAMRRMAREKQGTYDLYSIGSRRDFPDFVRRRVPRVSV